MGFAVRAALLCALLLPLLGASSQQAPLQTVLDRMRAASGLPDRAHIASAAQYRDDTILITRHEDTDGLRELSEHCNEAICLGMYFDGERFYAVNMNGTALPSSHIDYYSRGLRTITSDAFLEPAFARDGGHIEDRGLVTVDSKSYRRLAVAARDAIPMEVDVDRQTWLVARTRDANEDAEFRFGDYRRVGSYMLPFAIDRNGQAFERYKTRSVATVPFEPPKGLVPVWNGSAPMALDSSIVAPIGTCTIAGIAVRCLIDTGNSGIAMSLDLAEQLHAPIVGAFRVNGLGEYATEVVTAGPLRVGSATFGQAKYVVLHDIHAYGYDLVLGADVLANTSLTLDNDAHTATFENPSGDASPNGIALDFENFLPVVAVKLGSLSTHLAVDTGDQSTINLSYEYYRQHADLFKATRSQGVEGVGGTSVELLGVIPVAQIGGFDVTSPSIGSTQILRGASHGHIGAGLLAHFRMVLDYSRRRLSLFARRGDNAVRKSP